MLEWKDTIGHLCQLIFGRWALILIIQKCGLDFIMEVSVESVERSAPSANDIIAHGDRIPDLWSPTRSLSRESYIIKPRQFD